MINQQCIIGLVLLIHGKPIKPGQAFFGHKEASVFGQYMPFFPKIMQLGSRMLAGGIMWHRVPTQCSRRGSARPSGTFGLIELR